MTDTPTPERPKRMSFLDAIEQKALDLISPGPTKRLMRVYLPQSEVHVYLEPLPAWHLALRIAEGEVFHA